MKGFISISLALILFLSCQKSEKFDSVKWKKAGGEKITLDVRAKMVSDLIDAGILLNKNESQLIELLGQPSRIHSLDSEDTLYFAVQEKYGWNIDPEELIFLKITLDVHKMSNSVELYSTK